MLFTRTISIAAAVLALPLFMQGIEASASTGKIPGHAVPAIASKAPLPAAWTNGFRTLPPYKSGRRLVSLRRGFAATLSSQPSGLEKLAPAPSRRPLTLLGSLDIELSAHRYARQWNAVKDALVQERRIYEACDADMASCDPAIVKWRSMLKHAQGLTPHEQLARVNRFANNAARYVSDRERHGRDHWLSPLRFLAGKADCEDYAIFKFASLIELGFTQDQMRIAVVKNTAQGNLHAVLAVKLDGRTLILDNLYDAPARHEYLLKYEPVTSFNLKTQWGHLVTPAIRKRFVDQVIAKAKSKTSRHAALDASGE